ncbi:MAG: bifunctional D-glycero-beta-D-manno-heptose-7-phosphate kinase/D-glycero-beta-D-manno-heptose 1-phosphate adenylyltransferase HldE [gamma proteobacterium symbiont of Bathyaustriella thionipta]|nr:bifunctional D-glycero-beta-D-manno-heptose-7-phosphate kinase/D-glycero-beta-D-manno-heptose 1-phosphate adenylyltransferase HldE [gamma proteobacterium symbiont of Bathyaustriella thionipta]MCU7949282.1 bifunctional D-glycero-beta-D-manno-heptose-7-phosphate kinase/D-glycero-beta-D-manno-heptose 1-phosphate adenylyltransferase HldE [gamma proteobacterium symbiont of Bathyaustriella thionipta]MCU7954004.1 bifunctional D-glycero-beta-D-manno-heptose-7-phosphate kinase/D-glycero-beta-D-manno-he
MQLMIPDFSQVKILVVGDLMLDRYWHGPTSRISPEAPVPVVKIEESEERAGGAGNVALNIAALNGTPSLVGLTGQDEPARILKNRLTHQGVNCQFVELEDCTTITKLRVLSRHQQLIRLDFEDGFLLDNGEHSDSGELLLQAYQSQLDAHDVIVFSDYQKGTLRDLPKLIALAKAQGKKIIIDPKGNDFSIYQGATLLTPNLSEFEAIVGHCENDEQLVKKAEQLCQKLQLDALLITRSEKGMTLIQSDKPAVHLPTRARDVYDVTGAGDTVIATFAASIAVGMDMVDATKLANLAASVVVSKVGTASVTVHELRTAMRQLSDVEQGIIAEDRLIALVNDARNHGEKVIMTNGCFDILHAGHVTYLEQAKSLGDRLIVAVNDDDSVKRIKGPERPVNSMNRRMQVLAGLSCVDWVVPFYEDTPTRLICDVSPSILVKGGDNEPDNIPGGDCVKEQGGEVLVMEYVDNCSTTGLIRSIRSADESVENKKEEK